LNAFAWRLSLRGAGILGAAVMVGWWLVTRALRPIHDISTAATKIAVGDLSQRINARETDSELDQLAGVLNSTFARLEAAFSRQQRFTADAAHELRTPVTVIVTHVQNALAAGGLTAEHREAFEACERAAQRMRRLIESLLQLARLDAGEEGRNHERTDLAALTTESVNSIRSLAEGRKITLTTNLAPTEITGDPGRLQQVITNLVSNAIHHGRDGGEVRISVHSDADHAVLTVADNGPGIAPEHVPHLFERFYRVDKARTSTAGRTGLGLAIVKAITDAHGGTITVESQVGESATFTVRLPRA
jgi:two-component system OmpR family sensor kinase